MPLGRAVWHSMQPKRKKCDRCNLYSRENLDKCRWCGDLDEQGLALLRERIEHQHQSNKSLGRLFIVLAVITALLIVLM